MPCVEISDSIVQMGRLTLEQSIHHLSPLYKVVYGDTDSLFILCSKGTLKEEKEDKFIDLILM